MQLPYTSPFSALLDSVFHYSVSSSDQRAKAEHSLALVLVQGMRSLVTRVLRGLKLTPSKRCAIIQTDVSQSEGLSKFLIRIAPKSKPEKPDPIRCSKSVNRSDLIGKNHKIRYETKSKQIEERWKSPLKYPSNISLRKDTISNWC